MRTHQWLNAVIAVVVLGHGLVAGIHFATDAPWWLGAIWLGIGLVWTASIWLRTSTAWYDGQLEILRERRDRQRYESYSRGII